MLRNSNSNVESKKLQNTSLNVKAVQMIKSRESYRDMIRKAGPKQDSARQSADAIRNYMDERTKIKQIINKFG